MKHAHLIFVFVLLAIAPVFVYRWVSAKDKKYDELVRSHECRENPCKADFNGDGIAGSLVIEWRNDSSDAGAQWLIASDSGRELLRLPFWYRDNTLRSHAAIRYDGRRSRLLIYWGAMREPKNDSSVYVWSDGQMVEIAPNDDDRELLSAMAARDDSGGFNDWVLFRLQRDAALTGYYILLFAATLFVLVRLRKRRGLAASKI